MKIVLFRQLLLVWCCLASISLVHAAETDPAYLHVSQTVDQLDKTYPVASITTMEMADTALSSSVVAETELKNWFDKRQSACYERFFVNGCLKEGKLLHRDMEQKLRRINLEAKMAQRKLHIDQLDSDLAEKNKGQ